ncbi:MAG TPA: sulfotransferase family protein [Nocardioidaceae bacterium]|nr:sulfotransferase family protein [Nocardioidaceae bacterium]
MGRYLCPVPEHNVIYVKNPKAGCSTILVWLDRLHTGDNHHEFGNVHREDRLPRVREVGRATIVRMLSGGAYRFSFVRHPVRRFESVYWDKMVYALKWRKNVPAALGLDLSPDTTVPFEQFLSIVEEQDPVNEMDPHWRPQHVNLMHPLVTYDHVGRLEDFAAELEYIREAAGLPQVPLEVRNTSRRTETNSVYDGRPDLVRRVERLYATDFELYGY